MRMKISRQGHSVCENVAFVRLVSGLQSVSLMMRHTPKEKLTIVLSMLTILSMSAAVTAAETCSCAPAEPQLPPEPLTQEQVEILVGQNLDKAFRHYQRHRGDYENFVAWNYQRYARKYLSGRRQMRTGGILMALAFPVAIAGGIMWNLGGAESSEADDSGDFSGMFGGAIGGLALLAGGGMAASGVLLLVIGGGRMSSSKVVVDRLQPYVDYYAPDTARRFQLSGIGVMGSPHGAMAGAAISF